MKDLGLWIPSLDLMVILWLLVVITGIGGNDNGMDSWTKSWIPFLLNTWQGGLRDDGIWIQTLRPEEGKNKEVWEDDCDFE